MILYSNYSKKINSKTLKAASIDAKNDIISTSVILIAMIVMGIFEINIDGYLGLIVSLFVIYSSINVLIETTEPLIGVRPTKRQVKEIKKKIMSYEFVLGMHDLMIHNYGVLNNYVTVHIELDSTLSMIKAHDLIDMIENDFKENMNTTITIHVDPVIVGNKKLDKLKEDIITSTHEIDNRITIHDFRVLHGKNRKIVLFDAVLPFECNYDYSYIENYLKKKYNNYDFDIEIDRPYC
jgi:divalent metal cation (Fe/Co/Zn/Cd) transporter